MIGSYHLTYYFNFEREKSYNMIYNGVRSVDACKHVLLAVHGEGIYEEQKNDMVEYYGEEIFKQAEDELYNSRIFKLIFEEGI